MFRRTEVLVIPSSAWHRTTTWLCPRGLGFLEQTSL